MSIAEDQVLPTTPASDSLTGASVRKPAATAAATYPVAPVRKPSRMPMMMGIAAVVLVIGGGSWMYATGGAGADDSILTYTVQRDSFDIRVPLNGELKASKNVEIRSQVEGQTTIIKLIPEGSRVKEGDLLVTLASDTISDKLEDSRIRVENAKAATINSQESVRIQEMQNESDIKAAETNTELAKLEFMEFDKGNSNVQLETLKTALENAKTDLERKTKDRQLTEELAAKQFVNENDVLDAVIAERDAKNKLETAQLNLDVWNKYGDPRQRQSLQLKMEQAASELARVKARANANLLLRQADLAAKQSTQKVEEARYKFLQDQLAACTIRAPQAGMVVYQTSISGYNNQGPMEEGATVRLNQTLIQLPDTGRMQVEVRLAEQLTDKVRTGQEVTITLDAIPGKVFHGKVESIAVLPDSSNRWANPNLKEYLTEIAVSEFDPALKPGMSAKAEILVGQLDNVLAVPLQAIFTSGGEPYVFVGNADHYERRPVVTGQSNSTRMEIRDGLRPGEVVLLSRPKNAPQDVPVDMAATPEKKNKPATAAPQAGGAAKSGGAA